MLLTVCVFIPNITGKWIMAQFWKSHLKPHNISSMHERVLGSSHPCASLTDHYDPGCNRDDCLQFTNLDPSLLEMLLSIWSGQPSTKTPPKTKRVSEKGAAMDELLSQWLG
ncbi:uncharacterized protein LOC113345724 [Papaver somniferum]|uniref:uncharacterized protein LOC113345724 n=1 Tax=Papaver somniferum TaxID=3469 RepID=UPI000E705B02|nr:uncharacterized protein LOC113345724 [Papaver somniferum]